MVRPLSLWQKTLMAAHFRNRLHWLFCAVALAMWLALGWPSLATFAAGAEPGGSPVPPLWLLPYSLFGAAVFGAIALKPRPGLHWALLCVQLAAVVAMAAVAPRGTVTIFLMIIAWQVALISSPVKALAWVGFQTLAVIGALVQAPSFTFSYLVGLSFVLQLFFVFIGQALRREEEAARALVRANGELQSAQAILASTARDAERVRISSALQDAWGHDLTALGLQLEIAGNVREPERAAAHVVQAKGLARALLAKVRDVVAVMREAERGDLNLAPATADVRGTRLFARDEAGAEAAARGSAPLPAGRLASRHVWIFSVAALAVWFALGWPVLQQFVARGFVAIPPGPAIWLASFLIFGAAVFAAMALKPGPKLKWALIGIQLLAVMSMAYEASWAMMSMFLIIIAWQVAMLTTPLKASAWVAFQMLAVMGALALAPKPDFCWVLGKSFALQLCFLFGALALRREADTARAFAQTNRELRSAQAIVARSVRDAERLRISRELHDAWGHELTALGLQLEIASNVTEPARANDHVMRAKDLSRALLAKVRNVVAALREDERCNLKEALLALAQSVPTPAIHVEIAEGVRVSPDQAHALMRCAQEAVTNAVRHAEASNLWLQVTEDGVGVRLVARNDGNVRPAAAPGSGLLGMRERVEALGGRLAVQAGAGLGFTIDAWLPSATPSPA